MRADLVRQLNNIDSHRDRTMSFPFDFLGARGLGSPLGLYLAAAGVGRIGLVDFDAVDYSNLQRQVLHDTANVGKSKLKSALERLRAINPEIKYDGYETR